MCGIFGAFGEHSFDPSDVRRVLQSIQHRGPDDWGVWSGCQANRSEAELFPEFASGAWHSHNLSDELWGRLAVGDSVLGHTRLSVQDPSRMGHQPMSFGSLHLVFNGEIYNFIQIRAQLRSAGYTFDSNTDTEVLLKAYAHWGEACLERFDGAFAFVIWDSTRQFLFGARDRLGKKPLYYLANGSCMLFASEIKALWASRLIAPQPVPSVAVSYIRFGDLPQSGYSFYEGILQLPAGHFFTWMSGDAAPKSCQYWEPTRVSLPPDEHLLEEISVILGRSLRDRLRTDVPIALCLSGGVDSTLLLVKYAELIKTSNVDFIDALSAVQPNTVYDESYNLDTLAAAFPPVRIRRIETYRDTSFEKFLQFIRANDEPLRYSGTFNQYLFMENAKRLGFHVVLSGQGADELFFGYPWYIRNYIKALLHHRKYEEATSWITELASREGKGIDELSREFAQAGNLSQILAVSRKVSEAWLHTGMWDAYCNRFILKQYELDMNWRRFHADEVFGVRLPGLLKDEDRNSSAHGVETRLPYLDHRLVELALSCADTTSLRGGHTKWSLRKLVQQALPSEIAWSKRKVGFYVPFTLTSQEYLADMPRTIGRSEMLEEFLNRGELLKGLQRGEIDSQVGWRTYNLSRCLENAMAAAQAG